MLKLMMPPAGIAALVAYANDMFNFDAMPPWMLLLPVTSSIIIAVLVSSSR